MCLFACLQLPTLRVSKLTTEVFLACLKHFVAYLLSQRVEWKFSPARAPHFGVLWEAAVMSAKFHLTKVNVSQRLDFEELSTIAAQVESCLNSRPLMQLSSHSKDGISALTPGHFLIVRPLHAYPETTITTSTSML